MLKIIEYLLKNESFQNLRVKDLGGKNFFHYTNVEGLFGIISNQEFWLSDVRFMNDPYDSGQYAINLIEEIIKEEEKDTFKSNILKAFLNILREKNEQETRLVACFSTDGDKLSQWRAYGGADISYCLEFDPYILFKELDDSYYVWHMEYDKIVQKKIISEIFNSSLNSLSDGNYAKDDNSFRKELIVALTFILQNFKHPKYFEEEEFRLTYTSLKSLDFEFSFRTYKGFILPYKKYKFDKNSIKRIHIERKPDAQLAKISLEKFLKKNDFNTECLISEIPRK